MSAQLFVSQCKKPKGIPYVGEKMSQTIARAIETKRHWPVPPPPSFNVGQVHQNSTCWKSPTTLNEGEGREDKTSTHWLAHFFSHVRKHVCGNISFCFRRVASFHRKSKTNKRRSLHKFLTKYIMKSSALGKCLNASASIQIFTFDEVYFRRTSKMHKRRALENVWIRCIRGGVNMR